MVLTGLIDETCHPIYAIEFTVVQQKLIIEKDILLVGRGPGDSADLDMFEQRFSQLPEPNGSLMLCVRGSSKYHRSPWVSRVRRSMSF